MEIAGGKGAENAPDQTKEKAKETARNAESAANEAKRQVDAKRQQAEQPGRSR